MARTGRPAPGEHDPFRFPSYVNQSVDYQNEATVASKKQPKAVWHGSDRVVSEACIGGSRSNVDVVLLSGNGRSPGSCSKVQQALDWRTILNGLVVEEDGIMQLESKHAVWLESEPAKWGSFRVLRIESTGVQILVADNDDSLAAVLLGQGKAAKLYVNSEKHWERTCSVQMGPGLDWARRKSWDARCKEVELAEVARTGKAPAVRKLGGALTIGSFKASGGGWTESEIEE